MPPLVVPSPLRALPYIARATHCSRPLRPLPSAYRFFTMSPSSRLSLSKTVKMAASKLGPLNYSSPANLENSGSLSILSSSSERERDFGALTPATEASFDFDTADHQSIQKRYAAVVVGAGPGGICVVSELVEQKRFPILWIDPSFHVGRMGALYKEVPSNTRVKVLLETAESTATNRKIIEEKNPKIIADLKAMDQDKGCNLSYAVDMLAMFQEEYLNMEGVEHTSGYVSAAAWCEPHQWSIALDSDPTPSVSATTMILCTGSHPRTVTSSLPLPPHDLLDVPLDTALSPTRLRTAIPSTPITIGVMGTSHSAILVLMNLWRLADASQTDTPLPLKAKWFVRPTGLRYAEFMSGWTLRDNTGLKGLAADFARNNLEEDKIHKLSSWLEKVPLPGDQEGENAVYADDLKKCTHLVQAVGFTNNQLPRLLVNGNVVDPKFNNLTGEFADGKEGPKIPGLYGAGIAFPERVKDPRGNEEMNVGIWKFVKFIQKVAPNWK